MGYRSITVDGVDYKYTVGRTHVKVRGMGATTIDKVGSLHDCVCRCCGESMFDLHAKEGEDPNEYKSIRVQPVDVAVWIRQEVKASICTNSS